MKIEDRISKAKVMDRRNFLKATGLGGIGLGALGVAPHKQNSNPSGLKITGFETIPIEGRGMILKMYTNQDLIGYVEPLNYEYWRVVAGGGRYG